MQIVVFRTNKGTGIKNDVFCPALHGENSMKSSLLNQKIPKLVIIILWVQ